MTKNLGKNWTLVHEMVNPRFYWAVLPSVDKDENIIHMEVEDPTTGNTNIIVITSTFAQGLLH